MGSIKDQGARGTLTSGAFTITGAVSGAVEYSDLHVAESAGVPARKIPKAA